MIMYIYVYINYVNHYAITMKPVTKPILNLI